MSEGIAYAHSGIDALPQAPQNEHLFAAARRFVTPAVPASSRDLPLVKDFTSRLVLTPT